jgi:hypothetical protein
MSLLGAIRSTLLAGFKQLPLLLIGFVGLLGIGLGNLGLFMLFLGHTILVPIGVYSLQALTRLAFGEGNPIAFVRASDVGQLVPSAVSVDYYQNVTPGFWLTHIWFFFGYLFYNALQVYQLEKDPKADPARYNNRLSRAVLIMTITTIGAVAMTVLRSMMGTETVLGTFVSAGVGFGLSVGAYEVAALCGARVADIFGVAQQMLPASATQKAPMTCVYKGTAN